MLRLALCLLLVVACSCARPYFTPYLGIEELQHTGTKGSVFHEIDGGFLKLNYEGELHDGVLNMDKDMRIQNVECKGDYVTVTVSDYDQNLWKAAKVIAGGREWGCVNHKNRPEVILRIILSMEIVDQNTLVLETTEATYTHAFKALKMDFSTNLFEPRDRIPPSAAAKNHKQERNWFTNFWTNIWNGVKTITDEVTNAVEDAWKVIEALAEGSYEGSFDRTLAHFSFSNNTQFSGGTITCTNCGMNAQLSVDFQVSIHNYSVDSLLLALQGNASAYIEGQLTGSETLSTSGSSSIGTFPVATIPLDIGIPIVLSITVPVSVGYTASVTVGAAMDAHVSIDGNFEFGISYNNETKDFQTINQHSWTHSGNFGSVSSPQISADITLYVMPTFVVEVDKIGGPYVALKPFVEMSAGFATNSTQTCANDSFHAAFNWGLFISLGAQIDIWILKEQFGPTTLYSMKQPVASGCATISNSNDSISIVPGPPTTSDVWYSGNFAPSCGNFTTLQISLQIVEVSDNETYAMLAYYGLAQQEYMYCTAQALYAMNFDTYTFTASPVTNSSNGYAVGYVWCQLQYNGTFFVPTVSGKFSQDYSTIILNSDDENHCISAQLSN